MERSERKREEKGRGERRMLMKKEKKEAEEGRMEARERRMLVKKRVRV